MHDLFEAAGSLRDQYAATDWAATALGPVSSWSPTLATTLRMALRTRFPVTLFWGADHAMVYNEAFVALIGAKHPAALGAPAREVFPEIWDIIGPRIAQAADGADALLVQDLRLLLNRHGYLEETFFTFSYSPVTDAGGRVEGVLDIATETSAQVIGNRRLQLLRRLNDQLADVEHRAQLLDRALPVLRAATDDLAAVTLVVPSSAGATPGRPDRAGDSPHSVTVVPDGDRRMVRVPLADPSGGAEAVLIAQLSPYLPIDDAYLGFLRQVGGALIQALDRIRARRADRMIASLERAMSETLQHSLLTNVARPDHVQVAVRYQSSIAQAHIGGDWYDAFLLPDGTLTVVIGDVSGHDRDAAAAMAQIRNLLRGIAYTLHSPPSRILTHLGSVVTGLPVDAFATVVLAQIEHDGRRTLRWSNAGHPPPALLTPDGTCHLLQTPPETLLGTHAAVRRSDHTIILEPGATVVLYTDGLIERRRTTLDDGLDRLVRALTGQQHLDAEQLCDHLLDAFAANVEDDIALTVIQA